MKKVANFIVQKFSRDKIFEKWQDELNRTVKLIDYRTLPSGIETLYEYDGDSDRISSEIEINAGNQTKILIEYNEAGLQISHKLFYGEDDLYQKTKTKHTPNTAISETFEEGERVGRIVESWEGNTKRIEQFDEDDNLTEMEEIVTDAENRMEEHFYYDDERLLLAKSKVYFNEEGKEIKIEEGSGESPHTTIYEYEGGLLVRQASDSEYDSKPGGTAEVIYKYNEQQELIEVLTIDAYGMVTSHQEIEYEAWEK